MESAVHAQGTKLGDLINAAVTGQAQADRGRLFCSRAGLALINAAFDLFECDALYDLARDVAHEVGSDRCGPSHNQEEGQ